MGFTLGGSTRRWTRQVVVGLAMDAEGTVNGITSWMPIFAPGQEQPVGWTLDVMRRLPGGFRYSMEFLIASACISFRDSGCRIVSLSGAPLARADPGTGHGEPHPLDGFLQQLAATLNRTTGSSRCMPLRPSSSRDSPRCTCSSPTRPPCPASQWPSAGHTCPRPACATW